MEQGGFFGRWGGRLGWIAFVIALVVIWRLENNYQSYFQTNPNLEERFQSGSATATDKVAITIEGVIMHNDGFAKWQIDRARKEPKREGGRGADKDSPGGTVTGKQLHLSPVGSTGPRQKPTIKLVVSMGGLAASGGYYASMAVGSTPDTIFAEPTTWTGSIGVVIPHYDLSGAREAHRCRRLDRLQSDQADRQPHLANTRRSSSQQEKDILQALVNDSFTEFKEIVKSGRPKFANDDKALDEVATGQVYSDKQALENGLVDKTGYLDDAINRAIEVNGLNKENIRVARLSETMCHAGRRIEEELVLDGLLPDLAA